MFDFRLLVSGGDEGNLDAGAFGHAGDCHADAGRLVCEIGAIDLVKGLEIRHILQVADDLEDVGIIEAGVVDLDQGLGSELGAAFCVKLFEHAEDIGQDRKSSVSLGGLLHGDAHILDVVIDKEAGIKIILEDLVAVVAHLPAAGSTGADGVEHRLGVKTDGIVAPGTGKKR